ncbi:MAG TPA: glycosyltransferase family 4 protein [Terriglobia bacterium]|nr:glycosyltransferase family 4 protein [Terriglobia bacterium]
MLRAGFAALAQNETAEEAALHTSTLAVFLIMPGQQPISVCIIVENLPVPFDRRVWQEACALRDAGYRVSVISPRRGEFQSSYERREGIEIYRHSLWEASSPLGYLVEYIWALAAELRLTVKVYRRSRFRILHACNPPDTIFLIGRLFSPLGVRFIFDHHDLNPELYEAKFGRKSGLLYRLLRLAERLTYRAAAVAIATNDSYREIAIERGSMPPERVFVVRSSPDMLKIQQRPPQPELKGGKRFLVVYLGVMGPQEGLDLLLQSIICFQKRRQTDDTHFVLIGAGSELSRLRRLALETGLGSRVHFTGRIPDEEVAAYLSTADVCVAPDPMNPMNDKSTMNKILEYMAYSRPVVLFDLTEGHRAAGDAALYARPNDPADFAEKIIQLLDCDALRQQLGEAGRQRIQEQLSWEVQKQELLRAYEKALEG